MTDQWQMERLCFPDDGPTCHRCGSIVDQSGPLPTYIGHLHQTPAATHALWHLAVEETAAVTL